MSIVTSVKKSSKIPAYVNISKLFMKRPESISVLIATKHFHNVSH